MKFDSYLSEPGKESGHEGKFVTLFVRHQAAIHSFLLTIVPSVVDAEEILQDAAMTMWRRFDQFKEGTSFRNWAFQIAKFTAMNHIRKSQRDRHVFGMKLVELLAKDVENNHAELESRRIALRHCIEKLVAPDHQVLHGCYSEDGSVSKFAESEGRTPNAIYKQLNRIRRDLLRCVRAVLGDLNPAS